MEEKEKRILASTIERSLEKSPEKDRGREILEEALSFVQGEGMEEMPMEEEAEPSQEEPRGLMARRGN